MNYIAYVTNVYHYIYLSLGCLPQRGLLAMQRTKWWRSQTMSWWI